MTRTQTQHKTKLHRTLEDKLAKEGLDKELAIL